MFRPCSGPTMVLEYLPLTCAHIAGPQESFATLCTATLLGARSFPARRFGAARAGIEMRQTHKAFVNRKKCAHAGSDARNRQRLSLSALSRRRHVDMRYDRFLKHAWVPRSRLSHSECAERWICTIAPIPPRHDTLYDARHKALISHLERTGTSNTNTYTNLAGC